MKITAINPVFNFKNNFSKTQNIQPNRTQSIQKENFTAIPLETWQANKISNINKISFQGNNKQETNPIYIFLGPPLAGKGTTAKLLSKEKNIPLIGIGAILRENAWQILLICFVTTVVVFGVTSIAMRITMKLMERGKKTC